MSPQRSARPAPLISRSGKLRPGASGDLQSDVGWRTCTRVCDSDCSRTPRPAPHSFPEPGKRDLHYPTLRPALSRGPRAQRSQQRMCSISLDPLRGRREKLRKALTLPTFPSRHLRAKSTSHPSVDTSCSTWDHCSMCFINACCIDSAPSRPSTDGKGRG